MFHGFSTGESVPRLIGTAMVSYKNRKDQFRLGTCIRYRFPRSRVLTASISVSGAPVERLGKERLRIVFRPLRDDVALDRLDHVSYKAIGQ